MTQEEKCRSCPVKIPVRPVLVTSVTDSITPVTFARIAVTMALYVTND